MPLANRLIGREDDCARLEKLVTGGGNVTLIGPGGVGKTRLARELAGWREEYGEVVPFAQLADVTPEASEAGVAAALGYESVDAAIVGLAEHAGIVVLDNCEHMTGVVRRFLELLREDVTDAVVVATSRAPLGVEGEQLFPVMPLGLPSRGGHDADRAPAVQLFFDRALAAGAALAPSPTLLTDVGELCRKLDGLPLAIELAAARARAIAPHDLLGVVDRRLDLLRRTTGSNDRHASMRAAIEVSTSLLSAREQTLFRRLGVFTGPFDLELAHAIAGEATDGRLHTLDMLAALVERSLLTAETVDRFTRYRLLELLREHALGELTRANELATVEEHFVEAMTVVADDFVAEAMERWGPALLSSATGQFSNLVRAVDLCIERDAVPDRALRLLLPMFAALHEGHPVEVWEIGVRVLERWPSEHAPLRAEALAVLATAAALAGRHHEAAGTAELVVSDTEASPIAVSVAERAWGLANREQDASQAARHFGAAAAAAAIAGFRALRREVRVLEASQIDLAGDRDRALEMLAASIDEGEAAGDLLVTAFAHLVRTCVLMRGGEIADAELAVAAAEDAICRMNQPWWTPAALRIRAALTALGPGGWPASAPRWREGVDYAASQGAVGEIAILLRTAASVAEHLDEDALATTLFSATPPSTAITVLPQLFPQELAALRARAQQPPATPHLVEALARAREALDAEVVVATPTADVADVTSAIAVTGELAAVGDSWRVVFNGRPARVRDVKGIGDLAVLLKRPGVEVHALELMGGLDVGGSAGPMLDERARRAYQERIIELQRDIDEARDANDWARASRSEVELDALVEQLSEAFGLGGRSRSSGSSSERARSAVTSRIRSAIRRLGPIQPELARHLANSVRTGTWCSYRPEFDIAWRIDDGH